MNGIKANIRSLMKQVLKKLASVEPNDVLAAIKQSTETTYVLASDTGDVAEKNTSTYFGHQKLKEDTRRISQK